ncbi:unnamed protein product [Parnassius apollo]|uniref:(apollo) hypothetical protein n=1 Tax=Parnassius apollo TaxID=110799 RepID=A0A8S3VZB3_PARAO|nr:unnamed protein product [Parnassius apollo]
MPGYIQRNRTRCNKEKQNVFDNMTVLMPGVYRPRNRLFNNQKHTRHKRAVLKNGKINVYCNHGMKFFSDFFLALVENLNTTDFTPCIENIFGFTSTFLFSVEVHTTVAYGRRSITLECPQTIIAMCFQCILSSIFQVGDMRKSRILNIIPKAYMLRCNTDCENNILNEDQIELKVEIVECEPIFFLWPIHVVHVIDANSPLYRISAADFLCSKVEILVVFEGIIESTGQPIQARSSYTESDILWGHNFVSMVSYDNDKLKYNVDFSKLSEVEEVETPLCSAEEYYSLMRSLAPPLDFV